MMENLYRSPFKDKRLPLRKVFMFSASVAGKQKHPPPGKGRVCIPALPPLLTDAQSTAHPIHSTVLTGRPRTSWSLVTPRWIPPQPWIGLHQPPTLWARRLRSTCSHHRVMVV